MDKRAYMVHTNRIVVNVPVGTTGNAVKQVSTKLYRKRNELIILYIFFMLIVYVLYLENFMFYI